MTPGIAFTSWVALADELFVAASVMCLAGQGQTDLTEAGTRHCLVIIAVTVEVPRNRRLCEVLAHHGEGGSTSADVRATLAVFSKGRTRSRV